MRRESLQEVLGFKVRGAVGFHTLGDNIESNFIECRVIGIYGDYSIGYMCFTFRNTMYRFIGYNFRFSSYRFTSSITCF